MKRFLVKPEFRHSLIIAKPLPHIFMTYLIVGLGNPGKQYQNTRHNIGFAAAEHWLLHTAISDGNHSDFIFVKKYSALIAKKRITTNKNIIIAKPQTFMNNSGQAVAAISRFYKIRSKNIIVLHDELDLPFSTVRVSFNRSAAGHKGIQSIIEDLKSKRFIRVRIGIGNKSRNTKKADVFVLENFSKQEKARLPEILIKTTNAIDTILLDGLEKAMAQFH